ncbi:MAG: MaoC/PaaZ C-terminal domain-containing protein [Thermoanaerobaculales bacterium]|jgi:acyl dehydratase|nr:MaoC/PaaZ C-terminal domain-containing protein [Thermoanaerobaculales bacterium]
MLENLTYDEIEVGQTATYSKTVADRDLRLFAVISGDVNPVHLDEEYARTTPFKGRIAHGMITGALVSAALALKLPGPGTIYLGQNLSFRKPVYIGDTLTVTLQVTEKRDDKQFISIGCEVANQDQEMVATGDALVMAPSEKIAMEAPPLPVVTVG